MNNETFDYKKLYSDSRGSFYKNEYKAFISEAIAVNSITIEQYVIAENILDELIQISETKGLKRLLLSQLKTHPSENEFNMTSFIYILRKIDPHHAIKNINGELKIVSDLLEVEVRPRIDGKNAEPRLFFPKEKIALTSENDQMDNLGDILTVQDVDVYVIGGDDSWNDIYAYKIRRDAKYFETAEGFKDRINRERGDEIAKYR